ncbi:MAG: hypothetical protein ACOCX5_01005 [Chloroflexota bacterium]
MPGHTSAPPPDLRIVRIDTVHPHEEHDSQRALPLIERLREASVLTNPPIVAPIGASQFVILDGANRCYAMRELGHPHILVQVVTYDSGYVELDTWQHIVAGWDEAAFVEQLQAIDAVEIHESQIRDAICHIILRSGRVLSLTAPVRTTHERNEVLRDVVGVYQRQARLHRTAMNEPEEIWPLYPDANAVVLFPRYSPADIIAAAKYAAYLPPGVSRHIIHGRALLVNYPLDALRDMETRLPEKNDLLRQWVQERLANRQVRYYAETTYQFSE